MMLGGPTRRAAAFNALSRMCLRAAELKLIDPKINLRVSRDTPEEYTAGNRATREGSDSRSTAETTRSYPD